MEILEYGVGMRIHQLIPSAERQNHRSKMSQSSYLRSCDGDLGIELVVGAEPPTNENGVPCISYLSVAV